MTEQEIIDGILNGSIDFKTIHEQTPDICKAAIDVDYANMQYVTDQSRDIVNRILSPRSQYLRYVRYADMNNCIDVITKDPNSIHLFPKTSHDLINHALSLNPNVLWLLPIDYDLINNVMINTKGRRFGMIDSSILDDEFVYQYATQYENLNISDEQLSYMLEYGDSLNGRTKD